MFKSTQLSQLPQQPQQPYETPKIPENLVALMKLYMEIRKEYYDDRFIALEEAMKENARNLTISLDYIAHQREQIARETDAKFLNIDEAGRLIAQNVDTRFAFLQDNQSKYYTVMTERFAALYADIEKRFLNVFHTSNLTVDGLNLRFQEVEKASTLYASQIEKRFDTLTIATTLQASELSKYPTRVESDAKETQHKQAIDTNISRIGAIELRLANLDGRLWAIGVGFTILSVGISIFLRFIH